MARLIGNVDATGSLSTSVSAPATNASAVSLYVPYDSSLNDTSANGHIGTAIGNATISSTQAKFGGNSAYFDGSGDAITYPRDTAFQLASGDFTIEAFVYRTSSPSYGVIAAMWTGSGNRRSFIFRFNGNNPYFYWSTSGNSSYSSQAFTDLTASLDTWHHVAFVRSGSSGFCFLDGVKSSNTANLSTNSLYYPDAPLSIGALNTLSHTGGQNNFAGYIDDLRITKSVALYTQNFVPPSQAVGASLSGTNETNSTTGFTSVYLPFDVDLDDDSPNSHSVSANGNAAISATQAKFGGKSLALDGSGDSLSLPHTSTLQMAGLDFTIEAWVYISAHKNFNYIFSYSYPLQLAVDSNGNLEIYVNDTDNSTSYLSVIGSTTLSTGTWHHIAAIRNGSTLQLFVDGSADGSTSISFNLATPATYTPRIGDWGGSGFSFNGYIDDLRILKGFAKYTAPFTPPTSAVTASVSQTRNDLAVLYLPFDDGLEDKARNHAVTANGNAAVSATQAKFVKSLYLDGNGDYLTIPHSGDFEFNDDVFTIEFWMRPSATNGDRIIYNKRANNGTYGSIYIAVKDGAIVAGATSNGSAWNLISVNTGFGSVSVNTWYHVAVVREADKTFKGYLDGVATTLSTNTAAIAANTTSVHIGGDTNTNYFSGYLDDLMISKFAKTFSAAPTAASGGEVIDVATDTRTFSSVWNVNSPEVTEAFKAGTWPKNVDTQYTSLWMDGSDLTDKSGTNTVTASGVVSSTAQGKFGGSSLFFDGSNDRLVLSNSSGSLELDGAFTVEFFARWDGNNNNVVDTVINFSDPSSNYCGLLVGIYGTNWTFWMSNAANNSWSINAQSFGTASANTWQHISITSDASGNIEAYLDGTRNATRSHSSRGFTSTDVYSISRIKNNNNWFGGYIDDLFVLKGYQLRTGASFTVPTTPFAGGV